VGNGDATSGQAIDLLKKLAHMGELILDIPVLYVTEDFGEQVRLASLKVFLKFLDREYWHRVRTIMKSLSPSSATISLKGTVGDGI